MGITAIVLAAGRSSRFGKSKLHLGFDGKLLAAHVLEKLGGQGFDKILLVSGDPEILEIGESCGAVCITHTENLLGQSASIRAGVQAAAQDSDYMFFVCDQPLLRRESIAALLSCRERHPGKVVLPTFGGTDGNPVIFPAAYRPALLGLSGDQGGRAALTGTADAVYCHFGDADEGRDIDTPRDFRSLLVRASRLVVVRGGGDIATGVVQKLWRGGFKPVVLESSAPTAIRRSVALCEAVYEGHAQVEDLQARLVRDVPEIARCHAQGVIPVLVDEEAGLVSRIGPVAVVDAIIAKRNLGTQRGMAPVTIGLGPGFTAGVDVDVVVETKRGHNLGCLIYEGTALPNTGTPGEIGGHSHLRVIHSPTGGRITGVRNIGEVVSYGDTIAYIGNVPVTAPIDGLLRGLIRDSLLVRKGQKIADIDPREGEFRNWRTISDKARSVGGAVLEALIYELHKRRQEGDV